MHLWQNACIFICQYVDNILIFGTSLQVIEIMSFLRSKFDTKYLRESEVILGIKISRTLSGLNLAQEHYVENILRRFEL